MEFLYEDKEPDQFLRTVKELISPAKKNLH